MDLIFIFVVFMMVYLFNYYVSFLEMYLSDIYMIGVNLSGLLVFFLLVVKDFLGLFIGM